MKPRRHQSCSSADKTSHKSDLPFWTLMQYYFIDPQTIIWASIYPTTTLHKGKDLDGHKRLDQIPIGTNKLRTTIRLLNQRTTQPGIQTNWTRWCIEKSPRPWLHSSQKERTAGHGTEPRRPSRAMRRNPRRNNVNGDATQATAEQREQYKCDAT